MEVTAATDAASASQPGKAQATGLTALAGTTHSSNLAAQPRG